jgi:hypothetical protein
MSCLVSPIRYLFAESWSSRRCAAGRTNRVGNRIWSFSLVVIGVSTSHYDSRMRHPPTKIETPVEQIYVVYESWSDITKMERNRITFCIGFAINNNASTIVHLLCDSVATLWDLYLHVYTNCIHIHLACLFTLLVHTSHSH